MEKSTSVFDYRTVVNVRNWGSERFCEAYTLLKTLSMQISISLAFSDSDPSDSDPFPCGA